MAMTRPMPTRTGVMALDASSAAGADSTTSTGISKRPDDFTPVVGVRSWHAAPSPESRHVRTTTYLPCRPGNMPSVGAFRTKLKVRGNRCCWHPPSPKDQRFSVPHQLNGWRRARNNLPREPNRCVERIWVDRAGDDNVRGVAVPFVGGRGHNQRWREGCRGGFGSSSSSTSSVVFVSLTCSTGSDSKV